MSVSIPNQIRLRWPGGHKLREPESADDEDEDEESASPPPPPEKPKKNAKAKEGAKKKAQPQPKATAGRSRKPLSEGGRSVTTEFYNHATYEDMPVAGQNQSDFKMIVFQSCRFPMNPQSLSDCQHRSPCARLLLIDPVLKFNMDPQV